MTVTIGLIGAGSITRAHIKGYLAIPDRARVTAVADVSEDNARRRAEQVGGAAVYADYGEMIASADVDAVDICLPHHLHAPAIIAAARAGKHILCEKPLCLTPAEADAVEQAVRDSGVTLMCAHNQLFLPTVARARQLIDEGALGTVYELRTTDSFHNNFDPANMGWRAHQATSGGGELIDTGYHPTYLLLHLAASEPVAVSAMLSTHRLTFSEGEDSAQLLVRFADGKVGSIVTSWAYEAAPFTEKFSAVGDKGSLWSDGHVVHHKQLGGEASTVTLPETDTFAAEIADFVDCVSEGRRPVNTEVEGIAVLKVILAAYRSADENRTVSLSDL
ncbi:MAG: Gfo/Idh/MocA family oxidoreductase [Actinocatenispora sp.]